MNSNKNVLIKRRKSVHSQINCKSKFELNMNDNNYKFHHKKSIDLEPHLLIEAKNNIFQYNQKVVLQPIRKSIDFIKDDLINNSSSIIKREEKENMNFKSSKKINNKFRYNVKIKSKKKYSFNCEEKAVKPKSIPNEELSLNLGIEEKKNSDYIYDDNRIQIIYNSSNINLCYSSATQKGILINRNKEKENNQDISLIIEEVCGIKNYNIYCIMDGHGSNGHLVSNYIKEKIIQNFNNISFYFHKIKNNLSSNEYPENILDLIVKNLKKNDFHKIKDFYKLIDEGLSSNEIHFDSNFSGSTCIILFQVGDYLICSNVGDSRAIMIKEDDEIIELSKDHKPENCNEKERIEKMGGIISQCNDLYDDGKEGGPFRIWMKGCDYPGIAMSRSIGDQIAHGIGVSSEPEILNFNIDNKCQCLVVGSDGVWQYLSNSDISKIIKPFLNNNEAENCCKEIIRKASLKWIENDLIVDDITVSVIFLQK